VLGSYCHGQCPPFSMGFLNTCLRGGVVRRPLLRDAGTVLRPKTPCTPFETTVGGAKTRRHWLVDAWAAVCGQSCHATHLHTESQPFSSGVVDPASHGRYSGCSPAHVVDILMIRSIQRCWMQFVNGTCQDMGRSCWRTSSSGRVASAGVGSGQSARLRFGRCLDFVTNENEPYYS
jgi:hypothetical protein